MRDRPPNTLDSSSLCTKTSLIGLLAVFEKSPILVSVQLHMLSGQSVPYRCFIRIDLELLRIRRLISDDSDASATILGVSYSVDHFDLRKGRWVDSNSYLKSYHW